MELYQYPEEIALHYNLVHPEWWKKGERSSVMYDMLL